MASEDASWDTEEHSVADGTPTQHSSQKVDGLTQDPDAPSNAADSVEVVVEEEGSDDGADYDPESVTFSAPPQVSEKCASATPSLRLQPKPKMSGGFVMDASDDEDDSVAAAPGDASDSVRDEGAANGALQSQVQSQSQSQSQPQPQVAAVHQIEVPFSMPGLSPVMLLEARIKEDPRGDMDAWLNLIADHKRRNSFDELRTVYNRFLEVFPQAAEIWVEWLEMELGMDQFAAAEQLFGRCLMTVPNVTLWTVYLNYIRRRNDLTNDTSGQARRTIAQSYEFVIDNIGVDRDSGGIWQDYINFIKSGPGQIGGTGWQDQQKMDQLRKAYQRAITVPMSAVNNLWKEYDQFEMGLNKLTGRKFIQERSPGYMTAKSANTALDNMTRSLKRTTLPRLPPVPGFDGADEFREQIELWKKWIAWEKEDPLVLESDEPKVFKQRIMYIYEQALMALRFWPEIWVDAAEWCLRNQIKENEKDASIQMLLSGIEANPESVLLALKLADHLEVSHPAKEGDTAEYAKAVRKPYDDVLETLYAMGDKVKEREKMEVSTLQQAAAQENVAQSVEHNYDDGGDDNGHDDHQLHKPTTKERIKAIQQGYAAEGQLLSRTISYVWIALARAMRRIQGKGSQTEGGLRKVFTDARQKGRLTSDVYVAVALLESVVYKDPVGAKIFERGARLFPTDEGFMIEYLKFLHAKDDTTNARVVFETCANRLVSKPETVLKAKRLYAYFHKYESQFGELSQIGKLEERMAELFPNDPKLDHFISRHSSDRFDPIAAPIIISKAVQMRPKQMVAPAMERPYSVADSPAPAIRQEQSPRPQYGRVTASPKRPLGMDDEELNPSKRVARGVSPLKGAAGRRLDQQRRNQASALHRDITFLLNILPPSHTYDGQRFNAHNMTSLLRDTQLPDYSSWSAQFGSQNRQGATHGRQPSGEYGGRPLSPYGRVTSTTGGYRNSPLRAETGSVQLPMSYGPPADVSNAGVPLTWPPAGYAPPGQYGGNWYQKNLG